jgi:hypothetical protein
VFEFIKSAESLAESGAAYLLSTSCVYTPDIFFNCNQEGHKNENWWRVLQTNSDMNKGCCKQSSFLYFSSKQNLAPLVVGWVRDNIELLFFQAEYLSIENRSFYVDVQDMDWFLSNCFTPNKVEHLTTTHAVLFIISNQSHCRFWLQLTTSIFL